MPTLTKRAISSNAHYHTENGQLHAAIITDVEKGTNNVSLTVFPPGAPAYQLDNVPLAEEATPGHWTDPRN